jgi:hypothetical protein
MTFADFMVVDAYLFTAVHMLNRNYRLATEGVFETADWQRDIDLQGLWFLGNPFGRAWWDEEARHMFQPEFVAYVDRHLASRSQEDSEFYWLKIKARLAEN